jgi:hypothetical protein
LFVGKIGEKHFDIRPVFKGRNSFCPTIHGVIKEGVTESHITLTMRLHRGVVIFLSLLIAVMVISLIRYHELLGILFILYTYIITIVSFNIEYSKTKKAFQRMFEAA